LAVVLALEEFLDVVAESAAGSASFTSLTAACGACRSKANEPGSEPYAPDDHSLKPCRTPAEPRLGAVRAERRPAVHRRIVGYVHIQDLTSQISRTSFATGFAGARPRLPSGTFWVYLTVA